MVDSAGGVVLGAAMGLAVCWTVGAVLLYLPGQTELRHLAQESKVVSALTDALPPQRVMDAVGGIDPFSAIVGPAAGVDAPDPAIARDPQIRAARQSVVRVRGFACGLGIEGSGWIVRPGYVVTNAHVVAGVESPFVDRGDGRTSRARVVSFDARNDVAVLHLPGLRGRALRLGEPNRMDEAGTVSWSDRPHFLLVTIDETRMRVRAIGELVDGRLTDIPRKSGRDDVSGPITVAL